MSTRKTAGAPLRARIWSFIVYPESAPPDWREKLREELVPGFISPLHDCDVNPGGEVKKEHWHVILCFAGMKALSQVKEVADKINASQPQKVKDLRGYARYLCHLDNPEKAAYEVDDVECLCGADYLSKIESAADTDSALSEMMDWCIDNACYSFFELTNYARHNRSDWFRVLSCSRTVFLTAWLKSFQWQVQSGGFYPSEAEDAEEDS